jgi:fructose/tagatose bisphosphate aldolase
VKKVLLFATIVATSLHAATLATVSGEKIASEEINILLSQNPQALSYEQLNDDQKNELFDGAIEQKALAQQAKKSGVDYLAPAIGASHGAFKFKGEPKLEFELLKEVKKRTGIPLALHGASSIPDEVRASFEQTGGDLKGSKGVPANFLELAIKGGINKVNTDTDLRIAFMAQVRKVVKEKPSEIDPRNYFKPARAAVVAMLIERMKVLGSAGKI